MLISRWECSRFKSLGKRADEWSRGVGGSGHSDILKHAKIGKFGEMVMNKSNVSFRCRQPKRDSFSARRRIEIQEHILSSISSRSAYNFLIL